ncbi:hypothetical protein [Glutamicibacter ardleyensis]|uniref:hypothetical protein n=1 Tax=Glutamicibacter ardleyensis TaxID=225894 RepID=UPI003FCEFF3D
MDKSTQRAIDQLKDEGITLGEVVEVAYQGKYPSFVISPDSRFSKFNKKTFKEYSGGASAKWSDEELGEAQAFAANYFFNYNIIGKLRTDWDHNRPAFDKDLKKVISDESYPNFSDRTHDKEYNIYPGDIFAGEFGKDYAGYTLASDGVTPRMLATDVKVSQTEEYNGVLGVIYKGDYVMALVTRRGITKILRLKEIANNLKSKSWSGNITDQLFAHICTVEERHFSNRKTIQEVRVFASIESS